MSEQTKRNPLAVWGIVIAALIVVYLAIGPSLIVFFRGPLLLVSGIAAIMWLHKRRFERTNQYGAEQFNSFMSLFGNRTVEIVVYLLASAAILFGIGLTLLLFRGGFI